MSGLHQKFPVVLIVFLHSTHYVTAADINDVSSYHDCRGVKLAASEEQLLHMDACLKEAGVAHFKDLATGQLTCFGKCFFTRNGLIDEKGVFVREKMIKFIMDEMPKEVQEGLKKSLDHCLTPENLADVDPTGEDCTSYLPPLMCIHMSIVDECNKD